MKTFISFTILSIIVIFSEGCKNSTEDKLPNIHFTNPDSYIINSMDSIYRYYLYQNYLVKDKYKNQDYINPNDEIIWQTEVKLPDPILIDLGYGQKEERAFNPCQLLGDNNNLLFISLNIAIDNIDFAQNYIGIYNINGKFISNMVCDPEYKFNENLQIIGFTRWSNNNTIISSTHNYLILNQNGELIQRTKDIFLSPCKDPDFIWEDGYLFINNNNLNICYLSTGTKTISLEKIIESRYPNEDKTPKLKIDNISSNEDIINIDIQVTLYNGNQSNETIKINYQTGEIIS